MRHDSGRQEVASDPESGPVSLSRRLVPDSRLRRGSTMRTERTAILVVALASTLAACRPGAVDHKSLATQVAASIYATQTAAATVLPEPGPTQQQVIATQTAAATPVPEPGPTKVEVSATPAGDTGIAPKPGNKQGSNSDVTSATTDPAPAAPAAGTPSSFRFEDAEMQVSAVELGDSFRGVVPADHPQGNSVLAVELKLLPGFAPSVSSEGVAVTDE